jgi:hypothetical protein
MKCTENHCFVNPDECRQYVREFPGPTMSRDDVDPWQSDTFQKREGVSWKWIRDPFLEDERSLLEAYRKERDEYDADYLFLHGQPNDDLHRRAKERSDKNTKEWIWSSVGSALEKRWNVPVRNPQHFHTEKIEQDMEKQRKTREHVCDPPGESFPWLTGYRKLAYIPKPGFPEASNDDSDKLFLPYRNLSTTVSDVAFRTDYMDAKFLELKKSRDFEIQELASSREKTFTEMYNTERKNLVLNKMKMVLEELLEKKWVLVPFEDHE